MALVWLGTAAGRILLMHQDWKARAIRWTVWACNRRPLRILFERWVDSDQQEPLVPLLHTRYSSHGILPPHPPLPADRCLQVLEWRSPPISWHELHPALSRSR